MSYEILYNESVVKHDIPKLSQMIKTAIKKFIENKLTEHPEVFGKPLHRSLKNYRKLRIGDYRVIFRIEGVKVKILIIAHRSIVYQNVMKRM
jgi:mRNA interferase RelE/StbE